MSEFWRAVESNLPPVAVLLSLGTFIGIAVSALISLLNYWRMTWYNLPLVTVRQCLIAIEIEPRRRHEFSRREPEQERADNRGDEGAGAQQVAADHHAVTLPSAFDGLGRGTSEGHSAFAGQMSTALRIIFATLREVRLQPPLMRPRVLPLSVSKNDE